MASVSYKPHGNAVTLLITHPDGLLHDTGFGHPEQAARLSVIEKALSASEFAHLDRREAVLSDRARLELAHDGAFLDQLERWANLGEPYWIDGDTVISSASWRAAQRAAGAVIMGVDAVLEGHASNVFCALRPPGHHAERDRAMGFCLINQIAVGACYARSKGLRAAIVDWDVHHGNGTQDIVRDKAEILYISAHQMPLFPGTGAASEKGLYGNILNCPLEAGEGSEAFRHILSTQIIPALIHFQPDILFISAGFDAHEADPLGGLELDENDFAFATKALKDFTESHCKGRIISVLEGGYDLAALASSTAAHVRALMEPSEPFLNQKA